jgi:hypothetical protein
MKTSEFEPLQAVPGLVSAYRGGQEEFAMAAKFFAREARSRSMDPAGEECLELLEHLVNRLGEQDAAPCQATQDACVFLLEHLAVRLLEPLAIQIEEQLIQ